MARPDKTPEGGKFRALASAGLDGTAGAWGDGDLLNVTIDANGELAVAGTTDVIGVIWTPEGKRDPDAANYAQVIGGKEYTVFRFAEFLEYTQHAEGTDLYAAAAGAVQLLPGTPAGEQFIATVLASPDDRILVDISQPAAA